jgi:hypothetical protein
MGPLPDPPHRGHVDGELVHAVYLYKGIDLVLVIRADRARAHADRLAGQVEVLADVPRVLGDQLAGEDAVAPLRSDHSLGVRNWRRVSMEATVLLPSAEVYLLRGSRNASTAALNGSGNSSSTRCLPGATAPAWPMPDLARQGTFGSESVSSDGFCRLRVVGGSVV